MSKKAIISIFILFFIGSIFWYYKYIDGWLTFQRNTDTPKEFLNHTTVDQSLYNKDCSKIIDQLRKSLLKREGFFHNSAYFDSTQLIIDSIVYSPNLKKVAFLVLIKNPTSRQLMPDKRYNWYYDASCYLGLRKGDSITIKWMGPTFTNSYDEQAISNDIKEACFRTFVSDDSVYKYNLNDVRFWESPVWKKHFNE